MKKVLIAEDNSDLQYIFGMSFQTQQFEVSRATDGEQAIQSLQNEIPDVLILDINMPKQSGLAVLSYIRSQQISHRMKVIVVTGNYLAQQAPEAEIADLFLVKPVSVKELMMLAKRLV